MLISNGNYQRRYVRLYIRPPDLCWGKRPWPAGYALPRLSLADEQKLQTWLGAVLRTPLPDCSLHAQLKSGVVLCDLLNEIKPGAVPKISKSNMPFPQVRTVQSGKSDIEGG